MQNMNLWFSAMAISSTLALNAQRQYWGISQRFLDLNNPDGAQGIIRTDSVGSNATVLYRFGTPGVGYVNPAGGLLQASDGLVYCYTSWFDSVRVASYDPVTDSVRIVNAYPIPSFQNAGLRWFSSPVEGQPGQLVDAPIAHVVSGPVDIYRFNLMTEQLSSTMTIPGEVIGNTIDFATLAGTLCKANNGKLYGCQRYSFNGSSKMGIIDPLNNTYARFPALENDAITNGFEFNSGPMVQHGPNILTLCDVGGVGFNYNAGIEGYGVLGAFNMNTNTYQPLHYFDSLVHNPRRGFVQGSNGVLYGEAFGDTIVEPGAPPTYYGCIYTYDPVANVVARVYNHGATGLDWGITGLSGAAGLLAASNGKLYGSFKNGLFEYDPVADTLVLRAPLMYADTNGVWQGYGLQAPMIEICRKPNYKPRSTTSFNVCAGAHFFYDLQNVNATTVVWRRNGIIVPGQTSQLLEFAAITEGDEGAWECTLTNACGVTVPPAVTITVNAGAFTTSTISGDTLLCGNGDSVVLSGNNGGSWSTGPTTPTIAAAQPGGYFVLNQQACGMSMSNVVDVVHLDSAKTPDLLVDGTNTGAEFIFNCPNSVNPIVFSGNDGGPWGNLPMGIWQDGSSAGEYIATALDTGLVYVTATNACSRDTSQIYNVQWQPPPPSPQVAITDFSFGTPVDTYLCIGESLYLFTNQQDFYPVYSNGQWQGNLGGGIFAQQLLIDSAGTYYVLRNSFCDGSPVDTLTITVYLDTLPPSTAPTILPDQEVLAGCDQDTAFLSTTSTSVFWTWYDADFVQQQDTAQSVQVDWAGISGQYTLTAFNGCGTGPQDLIQVQGTPAPDVQYTEALDTLCLSDGVQTLSTGTPSGGTYSGAGVVGTTFNTVAAGIGMHTITYSYNDGVCAGYAQNVITVDACLGIATVGVHADIALFPNPNNGRFTLVLPTWAEHASLLMLDAQGRQVGARQLLTPGTNDVGDASLAPGLYAVRVDLGGRSINKTFVVVGR